MNLLAKTILDKSHEILDQTIRIRREIHMNPELSFREYKTSEFICNFLLSNNIDHYRIPESTGIIAMLEGGKGKGRTIALRAELDALPIAESTGLKYASKNKGIMHACGHDAHMAMLLSSILVLKGIRKEFGGKIIFIFQPGEEVAPGGAITILKSDIFRKLNPDLIIAQHVLPGFESGMLGFKAGKYMASSDEIHINIKGKGGHAALPEYSTDQILIGSKLVLELKEAVANYKSDDRIVFSIGRFVAEGATNIIPDKISIQGTLRTFDEKARAEILQIIKETCNRIAENNNIDIVLTIPEGYPVLINDEISTLKSFNLAKEINGESRVEMLEPRMSSEDFAHYSHHYPVVFFRTGIMSDKAGRAGLHTADFTIDEKAMETGTRTLCYLAVNFTQV